VAFAEVAKSPRQANTAALERRGAGVGGGVGVGGEWEGSGGKWRGVKRGEAKERRRGSQK
jgi:hypothetical protein